MFLRSQAALFPAFPGDSSTAAALVHLAPRNRLSRVTEARQGAFTICEMFLSQKPLNAPPRNEAERGRPGSVGTRPALLTAL
jgi:hypothetical protein